MNQQTPPQPYKIIIPLVVVGIFVIAFGTWLFREYFERYEETINNGWTLEARINPWLALEKYTEKLGYSFESYERIEDLEPDLQNRRTPGTVIITDVELVLTEKRVQALLDWVKTGGHLIIGLPGVETGRTHPLLEHFGVTLKPIEDNEDENKPSFVDLMREYNNRNDGVTDSEKNTQSFEEWAENNRNKKWASASEYELTDIAFYGEEQPARIHLNQSAQLDHEWLYLNADEEQAFEGHYPSYWAASAVNGTGFMEFSEGRGVVSFISDPGIWNSSELERHDHAWFLWQLARGDSIALLYGANMPALSVIIWRSAPEVVIAFTLWLVSWLIYRGRRFGAIREQSFTQRRAIVEHIRACAEYLWRSKKPEALVTPLQNAIHARCQQVCPGWQHLSPEQQYQWLLRHNPALNTIPGKQLAAAMSADIPYNESALANRVRTLQKIRELLL